MVQVLGRGKRVCSPEPALRYRFIRYQLKTVTSIHSLSFQDWQEMSQRF